MKGISRAAGRYFGWPYGGVQSKPQCRLAVRVQVEGWRVGPDFTFS
jgi:hypothetical protein